MSTTVTVIYDNPQDPGAFEAGYPGQLALAAKIPAMWHGGAIEVRPLVER